MMYSTLKRRHRKCAILPHLPTSDNPLLNNLISYWKLDEASGTREDAYGSNDLTDNNTVLRSGGYGGYSAWFQSANSEYLSVTMNSELQWGNNNVWIGFWLNIDTWQANGQFIQWPLQLGTASTGIQMFSTGPNLRYYGHADPTGWTPNLYVNVGTGNRVFVFAYYDADNDEMGLSVNDDSFQGAAFSAGFEVVAGDIKFGISLTGSLGPIFFGKDPTDSWETIRDALYNSGKSLHPDDVTSAQRTAWGAISAWECASNGAVDLTDSWGSNTLTDNNTVGAKGGLIQTDFGMSSLFNSANTEYLSVASSAELQTGDVDFMIAVDVLLTAKSANMHIIGKSDQSTSGEWGLTYRQSTDRFRFFIQDGATFRPVDADNLGSPSLYTWYRIIAWYDSTAGTVNIQVDDGTLDSASTLGTTPATTSDALTLGCASDGSTIPLDGRVDSAAFWKGGLLSADERSDYFALTSDLVA